METITAESIIFLPAAKANCFSCARSEVWDRAERRTENLHASCETSGLSFPPYRLRPGSLSFCRNPGHMAKVKLTCPYYTAAPGNSTLQSTCFLPDLGRDLHAPVEPAVTKPAGTANSRRASGGLYHSPIVCPTQRVPMPPIESMAVTSTITSVPRGTRTPGR